MIYLEQFHLLLRALILAFKQRLRNNKILNNAKNEKSGIAVLRSLSVFDRLRLRLL